MEEEFKIVKNIGVPAYQQIYAHIKEQIETGILKMGEEIPSEKEMIEFYQVSQITVRRALMDLKNDGYLKKRRGAATIVAFPKTERNIMNFTSFGGSARVRGDNPGSIILKFDIVEAKIHVAQMLRINVGTKVYYLKRIRLQNGRIVGINNTYISTQLGIKLSESNFNSETSLYDLLESKGVKLGSADETMEARIADSVIKRDLFLNDNQPVIYKERVTYDVDGNAVEFSQNTYNGEIYKYFVHIVNVREGK